jgi:lipoprotein-anchoring transpeptidase ErfK/SrfK
VNGRIPLALGAAGVLAIVAVLGLSIRGTLRSAAPEVAAPQVAVAQPVQPAPQPRPAAPRPADEPFVIKRILPIEGAIKYGQWHWDEKDVPPGPIVMTVDLDARVLSIFRGGYEIGAAAVLLGTEDKPTPLGVYPITQKARHHVSNLYDAPMPYMMRLTNDGITLHGSKVEWGYASHGCVGMPEPFAAKVFAAAKLGDRVFITRGKTVGIGESLVAS